MQAAAVIVVVLLFVFLAFLFAYLHMRQTERENRMLQSYVTSMQEYYQSIRERIEAVRQYRHDLAKHIQTLELLLAKHKESLEIREYIEEMKQKYKAVQVRPYCDNEIINAVCGLKVYQCEEQEIPISVRIANDSYDFVKGADMAGLLHNLLENAIEASLRIPDRKKRGIRLFMEKKEDALFLEVANQIQQEVQSGFATPKYPREEHGIGMRIIGGLVAEYQGRREYLMEENCFTVRIWLYEAGRAKGEST